MFLYMGAGVLLIAMPFIVEFFNLKDAVKFVVMFLGMIAGAYMICLSITPPQTARIKK